jgi:hypothetical protein
MAINKSIFSLRHGSNVRLTPTQEELESFLNSQKKGGGQARRNRDLARFGDMVSTINTPESNRRRGTASEDLRTTMLHSVFRHCRFFNPSLKLSVEQYQYHLHALATLDFTKPMMFIATAQQERTKLNPKKQQDAAKLVRLQGLVNERQRTLEALQRDRFDLVAELLDIATYISENLGKIAMLCDSAIGALGHAQKTGKEERWFTDEITMRFQEALRNAPRGGMMTQADLNTAKRDGAVLAKEFAVLAREDVSALSGLYEAIQNHARRAAREIDNLIGSVENFKKLTFEEEIQRFRKIEQTLVSLLANYDFRLQVADTRSQTLHRDILAERRAETIITLFQQLQQDRRGRHERRSGRDRRIAAEENYQGPDRRRGRDRRTGKNRRGPEVGQF